MLVWYTSMYCQSTALLSYVLKMKLIFTAPIFLSCMNTGNLVPFLGIHISILSSTTTMHVIMFKKQKNVE